jgi:hypothetical protein
MEANTKFLTSDAVQSAFKIIEKAIQSTRPKKTSTTLEEDAEKVAECLLTCAAFGFVLLLTLAAIYHYNRARALADFALGVAIMTEFSSLLSLIALIVQMTPFLNRARKNPVAPILALIGVDLERLMPYCNDLMNYPLPILAYLRAHVGHQRDAFDNRRARMIGQLDKVGTFPAIATLGISVAKLVQDGHFAPSKSLIWTVAGCLAALYLLSLMLSDTSDKFTQAIEMLDFVIDQHPEASNEE